MATTANSTLGECVPETRFHDPKRASHRWEIWMDGDQARAVEAERDP
jgi:hypothetical protein